MFTSLFGSHNSPISRARAGASPGRSARFEKLDERLAMAGVYLQYGTLIVVGTTGSDQIWISEDYGKNYFVNMNGRQVAKVLKTSVYANSVQIWGDAGNDHLSINDLPLKLEAHGGSGNDEIWGGRLNDLLYGDTGNDKIYGKEGNDTLVGGDGNDLLSGMNGNDVLYGDGGNDELWGDAGKDYLYGGFGNDNFYNHDAIDSVFDTSGTNWHYKNGKWIRV